MNFDVVRGDIAAQRADALVNAANTGLAMGSGVAGALRRGAGAGIDDEAVSKGPVDLGGVAVTDAYDLDAEWVIHAAAMPRGGSATAESIRDATANSLERADELGCTSLVLPALGCGIAGFDLREGARIIGEVIAEYEPASLTDVRLIGYDGDEVATIREATREN
ncbi:macro domain-containing protein [Halococcus hamelinensis]|uniref:Phosphatase, C-terminal domain of histone macro H2A1 like protein n=1 Tax=Halococcus hamelinensis 100A6 TaxID=1132509 RepID=M0MAH7_9EURY|nr:macro domain-containing protein [Halococcus hamelinensis]EMA41395.1 phosphatase, C-terminal domain of histone macro H2A1 like protein [Halococcus hamelinensis 100A6]